MPYLTYGSLVLTTLFWGGTFIAGRTLASTVSPANAAFLRFAVASLALLILARIHDGRIQLPPKEKWPALVVLGLSGVFTYNVLFFTGLQHITAGRASLIIALNPLAITVCARLFLGESLTFRQLCGIFLSLAGAVLVISNGHPESLFTGSFGKGELALLGCVASWVVYSLVGRTVLTAMSPLASVFYSSLIGSILLLMPALADGLLETLPHIRPLDWLSLVYLGICGTALGFSLYYKAIQSIGATRSGVFINLVPFFAILLSWLLLGESIKLVVVLGGLILMTGVSITNLTRNNRKR